MDLLVAHARSIGPLAAGGFRAVVLEADGRISVCDFDDVEAAKRYGDDAAAEADDTPPIAVVVDGRFEIVHRGRPYFSRP